MATSQQVMSAFRTLLRTSKRCFNGDPAMLVASAKQIRDEFETHRRSSDPSEIEGLLLKAREAAEFMTLNLVQAKLNDRGNYGSSLASLLLLLMRSGQVLIGDRRLAEMRLRKEHSGATLAPPEETPCKAGRA